MLRSRIVRTYSKLEIFTGLVDCRQKNPCHFQNLFHSICILHFYEFFFLQRHLGTPVISLPMMPRAERLIFFMEFVFFFFQGFEASDSDT